ncbi:MAG: MoxR family ATPase [Planctomycetia bacterium]|nr:MoxR family ATPase [Planctomycetia bacterium]
MDDVHAIQKIHSAYNEICRQAEQVIIGQKNVLEEVFIALLAQGHCLLEGVPGLGKTLLVRTVAALLSLDFQRIQCTPDLMPSDITGSEFWGQNNGGTETFCSEFLVKSEEETAKKRSGEIFSEHEMSFSRGPIFTNILLADEINRTPARTQSALLEAMQERQVTVGRRRHLLPDPFFVLATQNPIEMEGTYPLPEAQLDRFMFKIRVEYPSAEEELDILLKTTGIQTAKMNPVLDAKVLREAAVLVRRIPVAENVARYASEICRKSRPEPLEKGKSYVKNIKNVSDEFSTWIRKYVSWGAGPRAGQCLLLGAKARAILSGRFCVETEDIRYLAFPVLRHRIQASFVAAAEGITTEDIIRRILEVCE